MSVQTSPWTGLLHDVAAADGPGPRVDLPAATAAHVTAREGDAGDLVGAFVTLDETLPLLHGFQAPLFVRLTGGAGQVAGPAALATRTGLRLAGLELLLRDVADLAGNVRRVVAAVDAARGEGALDEEVPVYVEIPVDEPSRPWGQPSGSWLRAADEVAAAELRLSLRLGGSHSDRFAAAPTVAAMVDAALDRETPLRLTRTGVRAVTHRTETADVPATAFGFANALLAVRRAFDGAGADAVTETLLETSPETVAQWLAEEEFLAATRRWLTGWAPLHGTPIATAIDRAAADLRSLGQRE